MQKILSRIIVWGLWGCIACSIYLRATLFHMGYEYDELFTAITTNPDLPFEWILKNWLIVDVHPPLYNLLVWGWNHWVPYGPELWLRFPSFLMSLLVLLVAWFDFPKRFGKEARLLFVGFLSCNLYVMGYSQHARAYMLLLLFVLPMTFAFLNLSHNIWKKHPITRRDWLGFAGLALLSCWSHYFGALLVGTFFMLLFAQACYYKRPLQAFIVVPSLVFLLFLPWLVPNLMAQLEYHRFTGNWWANQAPYWYAAIALSASWAGSLKGGITAGIVLGIYLLDHYLFHKRGRLVYWWREQWVLGLAWLLFVLCVLVVSLKMFLFVNRYFICILPIVYLMFALFLAPRFNKNNLIGVLIIAFLIFNMSNFWHQRQELLDETNVKMPARIISQMYRDKFQGKEMFVVALESFPPPVMPELYGFYVNKVYHLQVPVTELFALDVVTREQLLERQDQAMMWMPNCTTKKLTKIAADWGRNVYVTSRKGNVCLLQVGPKK